MSQSSVIAFFLLIGFVLYATMQGQLPAYAAVLGFGSQSIGGQTVGTNQQTIETGPVLTGQPTSYLDAVGRGFASLSSVGSGQY